MDIQLDQTRNGNVHRGKNCDCFTWMPFENVNQWIDWNWVQKKKRREEQSHPSTPNKCCEFNQTRAKYIYIICTMYI